MSRGNFSREDIVTVLTANHGNLEAAFMELNKNQLKPFLMRIWGPPQGTDNESGNLTQLRGNGLFHFQFTMRVILVCECWIFIFRKPIFSLLFYLNILSSFPEN